MCAHSRRQLVGTCALCERRASSDIMKTASESATKLASELKTCRKHADATQRRLGSSLHSTTRCLLFSSRLRLSCLERRRRLPAQAKRSRPDQLSGSMSAAAAATLRAQAAAVRDGLCALT